MGQAEATQQKLEHVCALVAVMQKELQAQQDRQGEFQLELQEGSQTQQQIKVQLQEMSAEIRADMQTIMVGAAGELDKALNAQRSAAELSSLRAQLDAETLDSPEGYAQNLSIPPTPDASPSGDPVLAEGLDFSLRSRVAELELRVEGRLGHLEEASQDLQETIIQNSANLERLIAQLWSELGQERAISGAQRTAKMHRYRHAATGSPVAHSPRGGGQLRGRALSPRARNNPINSPRG